MYAFDVEIDNTFCGFAYKMNWDKFIILLCLCIVNVSFDV